MAEQGRCPQYWGDYDVQCVYHEGHEFPCVFKHPTGARFVSARAYRDKLTELATGYDATSARRELEQLERGDMTCAAVVAQGAPPLRPSK